MEESLLQSQQQRQHSLGGLYIFKLSDLPIVGTGGGLSNNFDFVRLNKCRMEFLPRASLQVQNNQSLVTFATGMDEVPMVNVTTTGTPAPTWSAQGGDDATITEATAFTHPRVTIDYIRGMQNSKETETFKKHVVHFYPAFYNQVIANQTQSSTIGMFERNIRKWVNLNYLNQSSGSEVQSLGPDFYGPMYAFSNNVAVASDAPLYDVKLHYSVSFRRLKGV